jgi:hypothetical protein
VQKDKKCTDEIQMSPAHHYEFGGPTAWPMTNTVFVRADNVSFTDDTNTQIEGDLRLMIKPAATAATTELARMKLTVVKEIGAQSFVRAVADYIHENNTTHWAGKRDDADGHSE